MSSCRQRPSEPAFEGVARSAGVVVSCSRSVGIFFSFDLSDLPDALILALPAIVCPGIATVFALPEIRLNLYSRNGLVSAASLSFVSGIVAMVRNLSGTASETPAGVAFLFAFLFVGLASLLGAFAGGVLLTKLRIMKPG